MNKISIYNQEGKKIKERALVEDVFGVPMKEDVVWHAIAAFLANTRRSTAKTKDKSERRGGGKKPWKQKGTGRARHGSIRSPLWRKGGVTFGPTTDINHTQKINKNAKRKALLMLLSDKVATEKLVVLDSLELQNHKTKPLVSLLHKLPAKDASVLFVTAKQNSQLFRAQKNLESTASVLASDLNVYDVSAHEYLVADEATLELWEKSKESSKKGTGK